MRERNRDKQRLEDIQNCISNVRQFINGVSFDAFVNDKMRYFAIMKNIEIIGEAANMLTRNFPKCQTPCEVLFLPKLFVFLKKIVYLQQNVRIHYEQCRLLGFHPFHHC